MWYRRAADLGNASAQFNLAVSYDEGDGVEVDHVKAFELYQKAAAQDHPAAQFNLAISYLEGEGVKKNEDKGVEWLRRAADQGYEQAISLLKQYD
jgi:TPR repeat protein